MTNIFAPIDNVDDLPVDEAIRRKVNLREETFKAVVAISHAAPTTGISAMMGMVNCLFSNLSALDKEACHNYFLSIVVMNDATIPEADRKLAEEEFSLAHRQLCRAYDLAIASAEGKA